MTTVDDEEDAVSWFEEPAGYYKDEGKPSEVDHTTLSGDIIHLHLTAQNPLWVCRESTQALDPTQPGGHS